MKKLIVTIAIVLGMGMITFAQETYTGTDGVAESGLFNLGTSFFSNNGDLTLFPEFYELDEQEYDYDNNTQDQWQNGFFGLGAGVYNRDPDPTFGLPIVHGSDSDSDALPLGSGIAVLIGLGAAYALKKRKVE